MVWRHISSYNPLDTAALSIYEKMDVAIMNNDIQMVENLLSSGSIKSYLFTTYVGQAIDSCRFRILKVFMRYVGPSQQFLTRACDLQYGPSRHNRHKRTLMAKYLMDIGCSWDLRPQNRDYPLRLIVENGFLDLFERIMNSNHPPNLNDPDYEYSPLYYALWARAFYDASSRMKGSPIPIDILLKYGAGWNHKSLTLNVLLDFSASINIETFRKIILYSNYSHPLNVMVKNYLNHSWPSLLEALHSPHCSGDMPGLFGEHAQILLDAGADIDFGNPLEYMNDIKEYELDWLLKKGVDVNKGDLKKKITNKFQEIPLQEGLWRIRIQKLVASGLDCDLRDFLDILCTANEDNASYVRLEDALSNSKRLSELAVELHWPRIRRRMIEVCLGMQSLDLSALEILLICDEIYPRPMQHIPMILKWKVVTMIKHYKKLNHRQHRASVSVVEIESCSST